MLEQLTYFLCKWFFLYFGVKHTRIDET